MAELTKAEMLQIAEENIERLKNKSFHVYFFVLDTKGNPSGSIEYIYQTALTLKNKGYNVAMLHQDKDFVGVGDWLGEEYAALPHFNIETDNVESTPSDFLFIPEIFANVMSQTKNLKCKRVILIQNYQHLTEFMPVSVTPYDINITDAITTTKAQADKVNNLYFSDLRMHVVSPSIKPMFRDNSAPRKLIVNVISKDQSDINRIIKPFYWNNPMYKWVTFRDLRGMSQEAFSEALREAAITIWMDDKTNFGYSLLESLRSGTLTIAKVPNNPTEWMLNEDGTLTDACLWFDDLDGVPSLLTKIVRMWTLDGFNDAIYENQKKFDGLFSVDAQSEDIEEVYVNGLFARRLRDFEEVKDELENNILKTKGE